MERLIAIKITSDGRAFVVDQAANAQAARKLEEQLQATGKEADTTAAKVNRLGKEVKDTTTPVSQAGEAARRTVQPVKQLGDTAERTAQQMRQVAPQVTDIVTSLVSGQSPMMVAIQQGGQLKDVFGGIAPAARAVGGYVLGMVNPLTLAAGAVGVLGAAYLLGEKESNEFNKGIILSGNAAGVTASRYYEMAGALAAVKGTRGAALEALSELGQRGRVAGDQLQRYTLIAQQLDRLVGKPVADTAKEFAALAEQPVEASLKLTQTYNYLSAAVYQQIKALKDQGREVEAGRLAQEAYAGAMEARVPQLAANMGLLEKAWAGVSGMAKSAWDAMLGIGRQETVVQRLAEVSERIREQTQGGRSSRLGLTGAQQAVLEANKAEQAHLQEVLRLERRSAEAAAERAEQGAARARFDKLAEDALSKQERLARAIAKAEADGAAAGASRAEIEKVIANERKKYADSEAESAMQDALSARMAAVKRAAEAEAVAVKAGMERLTREWRAGAVSHAEYIDAVGAGEIRLLEIEAQAVQRELEFARQKKNSRREVADLEGQLAVNAEKQEARRSQIVEEQTKRRMDLERKARKAYRDQLEEWEADVDREAAIARKRYEAASRAVLDYVRSLADESEELDFQLGLLGKTAVEQERLIALRRVDLGLRQQLRAIERAADGGSLTAAERAELEQRARATAAEAAARAETAVWTRQWTRATDTVGNGLYLVLTGRGREARDMLVRDFEQTVLQPTVKFLLSPISSAISSLAGNGINSLTSALGMGNVFGMPGVTGPMSGIGSSLLGLGGGSTMFTQFATSGLGEMLGLSTTVDAIGGIGTASTALTGAGSMFAAAMPWLAAAGALMALSGQFKGETRSGGHYGWSAGAGSAQFLHGPSGGDPAGAQVAALINANVATINSLFQAVGSSTRLSEYHAAYESSEKDRGGVYAGGMLSSGRTFGESGKGSNYDGTLYELTSARSLDTQQAVQNVTADIAQSVIQAWQAELPALPRVFQDILGGAIAEELSAEQAQEYITRVAGVIEQVNAFRQAVEALPFKQLRDQTFDWIAALGQYAGGMDRAMSGLQGIYENYTTKGEKRQAAIDNIQRVLGTAGLNFTTEQIGSANRAQFRELFEAYAGRTDEAGQKALAAILAVQGIFAGITDSMDQVSEVAQEATQSLEELAAAQRRATDEAMDALRRAVARDRGILDARIQVGREAVAQLTGVFDLVHQQAQAIYLGSSTTSGYMARRGQTFIDQALANARAGFAPEQGALAEAITAALGGMNAEQYTSVAAYEYDRLVLAGKLTELEGVTGSQLTTAQRQLQADLEAADALDQLVDRAQQQIDEIRYGTIAVTEALQRVYQAIAGERAGAGLPGAAGGAGGATGGTGGAVFGGGGASAGVAGTVLTSQGIPFDLLGWGMANLGDPAAIAAMSQRYGVGMDWWASATRQSLDDVRTWFGLQGVQSFDVGTPYVPYDMPAILHRGEAVLPARTAERWSDTHGGQMSALIAEVAGLRGDVADLLAGASGNLEDLGRYFRGDVRRPLPVEVVS